HVSDAAGRSGRPWRPGGVDCREVVSSPSPPGEGLGKGWHLAWFVLILGQHPPTPIPWPRPRPWEAVVRPRARQSRRQVAPPGEGLEAPPPPTRITHPAQCARAT